MTLLCLKAQQSSQAGILTNRAARRTPSGCSDKPPAHIRGGGAADRQGIPAYRLAAFLHGEIQQDERHRQCSPAPSRPACAQPRLDALRIACISHAWRCAFGWVSCGEWRCVSRRNPRAGEINIFRNAVSLQDGPNAALRIPSKPTANGR